MTSVPFPWIQSYPAGVHWDAKLEMHPVQAILDNAAAKWPENAAVDFMGKKTTYRELLALVNRAAKGFQKLGVKPGVHVGLYLPNTPHYIISFFGVLKAGGTVVNYSPLDALRVLEHKIGDSQTDFLVTLDLSALYPQMDRMLGPTRLKKLIVGSIAEMTLHPAATRVHLESAKQLVVVPEDDSHTQFQHLLDNDGAYQPHPVTNLDETIAVLQYTGGTTGQPKGAMLTHANLSTACSQYVHIVSGDKKILEEGQERVLTVLPLFHIYSLTFNMLLGLRLGAELVLHTKFELEAVVKDIAAKRISIMPGVPTMFTAIANFPDIGQYDLTSLKFCGSGGAPLPVEVHQAFQRITGCPLLEGWGMTETSPCGTHTPAHAKSKPGSCGIPNPGITLKFASIEDPTKYVPLGDKGEICIKGPNVMKGYWNNPEATAAIMKEDGFMRTGDVAYMDNDGFVFIVDRIKDMLL